MSTPDDIGSAELETLHGWEQASLVAERSVASLRKLVDSGRLRSVKGPDGVHQFARADLLALPRVVRAPESRSTDEQPEAPSAANNETALGSPALSERLETPGVDEGVLAAKLFEAFEAGQAVIAVVVATKVAPGIVEGAYETWRRLKSADTSDAPVARIDALETAVNQLAEVVTEVSNLAQDLASSLTEQSASVWRLQQSLAGVVGRVTAIERVWRR